MQAVYFIGFLCLFSGILYGAPADKPSDNEDSGLLETPKRLQDLSEREGFVKQNGGDALDVDSDVDGRSDDTNKLQSDIEELNTLKTLRDLHGLVSTNKERQALNSYKRGNRHKRYFWWCPNCGRDKVIEPLPCGYWGNCDKPPQNEPTSP